MRGEKAENVNKKPERKANYNQIRLDKYAHTKKRRILRNTLYSYQSITLNQIFIDSIWFVSCNDVNAYNNKHFNVCRQSTFQSNWSDGYYFAQYRWLLFNFFFLPPRITRILRLNSAFQLHMKHMVFWSFFRHLCEVPLVSPYDTSTLPRKIFKM